MTLYFRRHRPGSAQCKVDKNRASFEQFRYQPLNTPEQGTASHLFRLISLLPGSNADPICCKIQTYGLDDAPRYEALSYCWGDLREKAQIQCDNCIFEVTINVLKALTNVRHSTEPRFLWIDQICIDQQNLQERSYQVSIMRLIYSNAVRTIIWLGVSDYKTEMAFNTIARLAKIRAELQASGVTYSRIPDASDLLKRYGLPSRVGSDKKLRALINLLEQPWFERVWIVQEAAISKSAYVVQGKFETMWEDFAAAIELISELRMHTFISEHSKRNINHVAFIEVIRRSRKEDKVTPLRYFLNLFRYAKATDPRDKVYAFVGLSDAFRAATTATLSYERSVSDVYRLWTIHSLRTEKHLEILSALNRCETPSSAINYSWVPNWNAVDDYTVHHVILWPSARFQSSACSEKFISFRDEETVLGLKGYLLDRIEAVGLPLSTSAKTRIFGSAFLAQFYMSQNVWRSWEATSQVRQRKIYDPTGETMWDAYWRTMLFGEQGCDLEEESVRVEFDDFYAFFRKPFLAADRWRLYWIKHLWVIYCAIALVLAILGAREKYRHGSGLAFTTRCTQTGGRRLIRTQAGFIGLAVYAAEVGDYVALFQGARIPFVVRLDRTGWRLIGDSYVHGVMHGESWQADKCDTFWIH